MDNVMALRPVRIFVDILLVGGSKCSPMFWRIYLFPCLFSKGTTFISTRLMRLLEWNKKNVKLSIFLRIVRFVDTRLSVKFPDILSIGPSSTVFWKMCLTEWIAVRPPSGSPLTKRYTMDPTDRTLPEFRRVTGNVAGFWHHARPRFSCLATLLRVVHEPP